MVCSSGFVGSAYRLEIASIREENYNMLISSNMHCDMKSKLHGMRINQFIGYLTLIARITISPLSTAPELQIIILNLSVY